jgi:hypothetical protein
MYRGRHAKRTGGPKLGKLLAMTGLAGALVLSLAVPAALAGVNSQSNGGSKAYVTSDTCPESGSLEDNILTTGENIQLNLKMPGNVATSLTITIYVNGTSDNSEIAHAPVIFSPSDCGTDANLWFYDLGFTLPEGSYTAEVNYTVSGKNFSSDSFQVVVP